MMRDCDPDVLDAAARAVLPDPEARLDEWSEQNVVVPKGAAFSGPYRLAHTPPARRLLQVLSPVDPTARVVARVASQMLKTQVFICAALGWIDTAPANIIALEPTDGLAKRLSARFAKAADACEPVRAKLAAPRSRDKRNTIDAKEFDGGTLYITTAGSDANLAEIPARYLFCDEVSREGYKVKTGGEGDKIKLAEARLSTYEGISKAYFVSSPTDTGDCAIDALFQQGTQEHYHVPCPHCGHLHELLQANARYTIADGGQRVLRAWMICPSCGSEIEEHDKLSMLPDQAMGGRARWVATAEGDGQTVSVTLNAFYAPLGSISWKTLAKEHHQARIAEAIGNVQPMRVYTNTRLALTYERQGDSVAHAELVQRAGDWPLRTVLRQILVLTAAVDVQRGANARLEVSVWGWGRGEESQLVDRRVIYGDPELEHGQPGSPWTELDAYLAQPIRHASGAMLPIRACAVDSSDGHVTHTVYRYCRTRASRHVLAIKGRRELDRVLGRPTWQDVDYRGTQVKRGVRLWKVGTDIAKGAIYARLRLVRQGAGYIHLSRHMPPEAFEQLTAERMVTTLVRGQSRTRWVKRAGVPNEELDKAVYALAMAHYIGIPSWGPADWARVERKLAGQASGETVDMFAAAEPTPGDDMDDADEADEADHDNRPPAGSGDEPAADRPAPDRVQTPAPAGPQAVTRADDLSDDLADDLSITVISSSRGPATTVPADPVLAEIHRLRAMRR
ncbi:phage terminase large subunit family protein [Leptothrix discophora]|uniref:Phage terminase large subunit family protein n=1 Tax=Leptothrix discophora TaxID=89 RepID=A0ABT9G1K1_LEPDI|nr:terminase gpA endonuclease subunit [Leptothrix discophora]MDP4300358.1 phage terminase large subunit family protein [Leptothrix discophora]